MVNEVDELRSACYDQIRRNQESWFERNCFERRKVSLSHYLFEVDARSARSRRSFIRESCIVNRSQDIA